MRTGSRIPVRTHISQTPGVVELVLRTQHGLVSCNEFLKKTFYQYTPQKNLYCCAGSAFMTMNQKVSLVLLRTHQRLVR